MGATNDGSKVFDDLLNFSRHCAGGDDRNKKSRSVVPTRRKARRVGQPQPKTLLAKSKAGQPPDGSIRITREVAGGSGGFSRATYESVVDAGGNSVPGTALQRGYNAAGELNHVDPK
jgi:hypothetical protein